MEPEARLRVIPSLGRDVVRSEMLRRVVCDSAIALPLLNHPPQFSLIGLWCRKESTAKGETVPSLAVSFV